jgi:hypothetical protein
MLEFTEKVIGKIQIPLEITEEDIDNIIVSSVEGGSNSWMGIDNSKPEFKNKPKDEPIATWITKLILEGKTVYFYDCEEEEEEEYFPLTLEKLLKGIELNIQERPFSNDKDNWDSVDTDCIIQYALFGKLIYG